MLFVLLYHAICPCMLCVLSPGGQSPWHLAARDGHADVLAAMGDVVKSASPAVLRSVGFHEDTSMEDALARAVQQPDVKGLTPLHMACIKGRTEAAEVLMKLGANPFAMVRMRRAVLETCTHVERHIL